MAHNLYLRQSLRLKEIFAGYGGFVTFVKSNAKALSTAVPSIKSPLAPCRGGQNIRWTSALHRPKQRTFSSRWSDCFCVTRLTNLFLYSRPNIFQISAVRCSYQIPFPCRIHLHSGLHPLIINQYFQTFSTMKSCINP